MTRRASIEDLYRIALPEQPALAPDGSSVVYVLRTANRDADRDERALWVVPGAGGEARQLTRGTADTAPAWAPDGERLAFLRAQDSAPQLYVLPAAGGEPEQVTSLPLGAGAPVWSPDGTAIAFAAPVDRAAAPDEDDAARARRSSAPVVVDRLGYKTDGTGLLGTIRSHLHVLDLGTGDVRQVTHGDWHAGAPVWSPDGTQLAFTAARDTDADLTFRSAAHVLDVGARHCEPRLVGDAEGTATHVTWTVDGTALLVVGRRDTRVGQAGLLRVPLDGGEPVDLAAPLDRSVMPGGAGYPGASPQQVDGSVLFCVRDRGCTDLYAVDLAGGVPYLLVGGGGTVVSGLSAAGDTVALVLATPTSYGEIALLDRRGGGLTVLTTHGRAMADVDLFVHEERSFTVSDGTAVHGWLLRDPSHPGPLPLLLDIHGGPHNAWNDVADPVHLYRQELAARGWAVLVLNPRASDGYGDAFYTAALGSWGRADARDLLEPLDQLVAEGVADPARLAVTGYSYGGYLTCYLTSRDQRFAAAVAGGVLSDLESMAGTSDLAHWLAVQQFGGAPWAERELYSASSPLTDVEHVRTPTLVLHGADDVRCPVGQAEQWFAALRAHEVPSRLVLYPGGSHLFVLNGRPSHRVDYNRRVVEWVEQHAGVAGRPQRVPIDAGHWEWRLTELAERHRVPGAALGILRVDSDGTAGDSEVVVSHGVLDKTTGVGVTDDTLFQIGSISKVWTATLVMQLVDDGRLDLDAPVVDVLPELVLSDPDVTKQVTMRHLLTHTSGIDGDIFTDTGRGDDCLERYVAQLDEAAQNHPMGATFSYCNSGFTLAGRVVEKLTGMTWDAALKERLCAPLGLQATVTLPEEALLHRAAVGHVAPEGAEPQPAAVWTLPRSAGPAGLITASAGDVLAFARMHLTGGLAADGTRVLGEASAAAMAEKQVALPDPYSLGDSWGLGWIRFGWDGRRLVGHDGNTIGQSAFLRMLPEQGLAVVLLTNGGQVRDLYEDLYREVFAELADVAMPHPLAPAAQPTGVDASRHHGVYERAGVRIEVFDADGALHMRQTISGPLAELLPDPVQEHHLVPVDDDLFVLRPPGAETWVPVTFYTLPTGERYLHNSVRANPRTTT